MLSPCGAETAGENGCSFSTFIRPPYSFRVRCTADRLIAATLHGKHAAKQAHLVAQSNVADHHECEQT